MAQQYVLTTVMRIQGDNRKLREALRKSREELKKTRQQSKVAGQGLAKNIFLGTAAAHLALGALRKLSGAMQAFARDTVQLGSGYEFQMKKIQLITGASSEQFKLMSNDVRNLAANTMFTASQVGEGLEVIARAGYDAVQSTSMLPHILKLAGTEEADMATTTDLVTSSLAAMGKGAESAGEFTDTFRALSTNTKFSLMDMGEAMKHAATTGRALGWDIQEAAAAVAQFRNIGYQASRAGTMLKMSMTFLAKGSQATKDALAEIGLTLEDVDPQAHSFGDIMKTLADTNINAAQATKIFGARAGMAMMALIKSTRQGSLTYDDLLQKLRDSKGVVEEAFKGMMDTVRGSMLYAKSATEELKLSIFDVVAPETKGGFKWIADTLIKIGGWVKSMAPQFRAVVDAIKDWASSMLNLQGTAQGTLFAILATVGSFLIDLTAGFITMFTRLKVFGMEIRMFFGSALRRFKLSFAQFVKFVVDRLSDILKAGVTLGYMISQEVGDKMTDAFVAMKASSGLLGKSVKEARKELEDYRKPITDIQKGLVRTITELDFLKDSLMEMDMSNVQGTIDKIKQDLVASQLAAQGLGDELGKTGSKGKGTTIEDTLQIKIADEAPLLFRLGDEWYEMTQSAFDKMVEARRSLSEELQMLDMSDYDRKVFLLGKERDEYAKTTKSKAMAEEWFLSKMRDLKKEQFLGEVDMYAQLVGETGEVLQEIFGKSKALAIVQAMINTFQAVTKAYAQGGIFGIASGTLMLLKGMAQVKKIQAQTYDVGGLVMGSGRVRDEEFVFTPSQTENIGVGVLEKIAVVAQQRQPIDLRVEADFKNDYINAGRKLFGPRGAFKEGIDRWNEKVVTGE